MHQPIGDLRRQRRCLNEVRPRRPEQSTSRRAACISKGRCLNEVRPRRPEQYQPVSHLRRQGRRLNEVRPRRPEQSLDGRLREIRDAGLNEVRPRRPEQFGGAARRYMAQIRVSMKSGLEGRNNGHDDGDAHSKLGPVSMKSGLEGRNNETCPSSPPHDRKCLNEVRPRRPEQSYRGKHRGHKHQMSQ